MRTQTPARRITVTAQRDIATLERGDKSTRLRAVGLVVQCSCSVLNAKRLEPDMMASILANITSQLAEKALSETHLATPLFVAEWLLGALECQLATGDGDILKAVSVKASADGGITWTEVEVV